MAHPNLQDAFLLERVADPNSEEFQHMMNLLMTNPAEVEAVQDPFKTKGEFRYTFPFRGDPEDETMLRDVSPFKFPERGDFRNGVSSLAISYADIIDLVLIASGKKRLNTTVLVSAEHEFIRETVASSGTLSPLIYYSNPQEFVYSSLQTRPITAIFDHTTVCTPIDELLNFSYRMGIRVVDGVFPYHVAAIKGWDVVSGFCRWSYTHSNGHITVGPDDDPTRLMRYNRNDYLKFVDPSRWTGNARKYGYELRKSAHGLITYRAVYLGDDNPSDYSKNLAFSLPMCSSDDMVILSINRELAAGVFVSKSNNAQDLARLERNYAIEMRRDLFVSCVDFLIAKEKSPELVGDAIRYITQHNYVDLVDGVRIVRCASLSYADACCAAMVCALTAYSLRYRLTNDSLVDIRRHVSAAKEYSAPVFGSIERLVWFMTDYVSNAARKIFVRSIESAKSTLYGSDFIPGVCYDVYMTTRYDPTLEWHEPSLLVLEPDPRDNPIADKSSDPLVEFLAETQKTSAPSAVRTKPAQNRVSSVNEVAYKPRPVGDPLVVLQEFYDEALPGNSVAQVQSAAELRKVKDIDFNTEFFGKIEVGKDVPAKEALPYDASLRTTALPVAQTPLVDAILASAKRNFNPPDLQMQSDPWEYARYLVDKFISFAFVDNYKETLGKSYKKDPITFSVTDYMEWRATRDKSYRSALEAECPAELVELNLEKYDTIVKRRIKPKLSTSAQHELAQPQVIVSMSKKETAVFSSIFRKMFERFEAVLKPQFASAGRMSDDDLSCWFTENTAAIMSLKCLEIDSSKYDKSQGLLARMVEALLLTELGLDPDVSKLFEESFVGRVSSRSLGLMFMSAYQMKSGAPQTMLGNIIYNMVSAMECIGPENIKLLIAKGDDNLVWVLDSVDAGLVTTRFASLFNLDAKLIQGLVPYFSSGYVLPLSNCIKFVPDILKVVELLGERGQDPLTLEDRFISFQDRIRSLTDHHEVPRMLTLAMRQRLRMPTLDAQSAIDALHALTSDYPKFSKAATEYLRNG
nr:RNA-dependent RNA polymerase [Martellivirales sp.]